MKPKSKVCSTCKVDKPAAMFSSDASRKDGLWYCCRECRAASRGDQKPSPRSDWDRQQAALEAEHREWQLVDREIRAPLPAVFGWRLAA